MPHPRKVASERCSEGALPDFGGEVEVIQSAEPRELCDQPADDDEQDCRDSRDRPQPWIKSDLIGLGSPLRLVRLDVAVVEMATRTSQGVLLGAASRSIRWVVRTAPRWRRRDPPGVHPLGTLDRR